MVVSNGTTKLSLDDDLDVVWAQVIVQWRRETGVVLDDKASPKIDDVVARINPPKADPTTKTKAKTVFMNALTCVQRFGQFAANAAGAVFGPSQQCFNAINFIIVATQDYNAVFGNLTALMDRLAAFLDRMKLHLEGRYEETKLDRPMRTSVYKVLEHFMTIMKLAHKLTDGWKGKFKLALKVGAFGDDDGVKAALMQLETLVADVTRTEITSIYRTLNDAARNIVQLDVKVDLILENQTEAALGQAQLVAGVSQLRIADEKRNAADEKRSTIDEDRRDREKIREKLSIDQKESWRETQEAHSGKQVDGSGDWLFERYIPLRNWADCSSPAPIIFSIDAPENFGKSVLSCTVIKHLTARYAKGSEDRRVAVSYYYFDLHSQEKKDSVNAAVRALIWQLANADRGFAKSVKKALEGSVDIGRTSDLWEKVVMAAAKSTNATFYLVLDGVDEAETEPDYPLAKMVKAAMTNSSGSGGLRLRFFLSGRREGLQGLEERSGLSIPGIKLDAPRPGLPQLPHEEDLQKFVQSRLERMDTFKGAVTGKNADLKDRLPAELARMVSGNYYQLQLKLNAIDNSNTVEEVEEILQQVDANTTQAIERNIERLNRSLARPEVLELNELLAWVSGGMIWPGIKLLNAALQLKFEKQQLSLAKQIKTKYSALLEVDEDEDVSFPSSDIEDFLIAAEKAASEKAGGLTAGSQIVFHESEVALIRRIVKTHFNNTFGAEDLYYEKFGLDSFFDGKLGDQAARIHLDETGRHLKVLEACLLAMCDRADEPDFEPLRQYAYNYFADHLVKADLVRADPLTKQNIGRRLVRLMKEETFINAWWAEERLDQWRDWLIDPAYCDGVVAWLGDSTVQKGFQDMPLAEKEWIKPAALQEAKEVHLLQHIAHALAQRWYGSDGDVSDDLICWIHGYVCKTCGEQAEDDPDISIERMTHFERWVRAELQEHTDQVQWDSIMARTLHCQELYHDAIPRWQAVLNVQPDNWQAAFWSAKTLSFDEQEQEAVNGLTELFAERADLLDTDPSFTKLYWEEMLPLLAKCNQSLHLLDAATETYRKVLDHTMECMKEGNSDALDFLATNTSQNLVSVLQAQGHFLEIIELVQNQHELSEDVQFRYMANWTGSASHQALLNAARNEGISAFETVHECYDAVLAKYGTNMLTVNVMRWARGRLRWYGGLENMRESALSDWELNVSLTTDEIQNEFDGYVPPYNTKSAAELAKALLDRAVEAGLDSPVAQDSIKRLDSAAQKAEAIVRPRVNKDLRLVLARLHHLAKNQSEAMGVLRGPMKEAFEIVSKGEEDAREGYLGIAHVLSVLEDNDSNVLAAWQLLEPNREDTNDAESDAGTDVGSVIDDAADDTVHDDVEEDGQATAGAEDEAESETENESVKREEGEEAENASAQATLQNSEEVVDAAATASNTDATGSKPSGWLQSGCDGGCGYSWQYVDNIHICRDCLDVQLCTGCYAKLQTGTLDVGICNVKHQHVYIPPFDLKAWRERDKDKMLVGEKLVDRKDWLEGLKKDWGYYEGTMKTMEEVVEDVKAIQSFWRARKEAMSPTIPTS